MSILGGANNTQMHAIHLDVICPSCGYDGFAPLLRIDETVAFPEHWTVVCPSCSRGWVVSELPPAVPDGEEMVEVKKMVATARRAIEAHAKQSVEKARQGT